MTAASQTPITDAALLLLGAAANGRITKHGGYVLFGRKVHDRVQRLRDAGLVEDGDYVYHGANQFPDYSVVSLTDAGKALLETARPFPWRALCQHCDVAISRDGWASPWARKTLHGTEHECPQAPSRPDGDPGSHAPRRSLSANGPTEPERQ